MNEINKADGELLRQKAEELLKKKTSGTASPLYEVESSRLIYELQVHQIELELQNEELRHAQSLAEIANDKYIRLYDFAPSGYFTLSGKGKIIELNLSGARMLGNDRQHLKNRLFGLYISEETKPIFSLFLEKAFKSKTKESCEVMIDSAGRLPFHVLLTGVVSDNEEHCLVTAVDITEHKQAEKTVNESEEKFRKVFSCSRDALILIDKETGNILDANDYTFRLYGYSRDEILNLKNTDLSFEPVKTALALKEFIERIEVRYHKKKDGTVFPVDISASRFMMNGREVVLASIRDITDRKIAEETLRENDARYSSMISNISDVIGIMGADGIMTYKSSNIEKWFGWLPQDRVGTSGFSTVHPDDMEYVGKVFYSLLEKDNAIAALEFRYQCKDGSYKPIELTAANLLNDPAINGVLLNYHDITGRRQTENILRKTNAQLESAVVTANEMTQLAEASSKSKSTFLANMSHEIRTPLNAIIGFSQLMNREKSLTDSQRKYVTSINSAGEHLLKLINDILELSKLGAGRMEINPTNFDLHAVFNEVQMMFKELSLSKRLQLVVELSGDLPHDVIADSHKLRQILINLIGNAIKFTNKGSIFVRASVDKRNKDTSRLVVEIQDTGPGISEDELGKLFKQFEQTSAGILKNSGTGLGLALSRELAVLMGGNITVASEEGKGSVFTIHVALKEGKSEVSEAANAKRVICIDNPQKAYRVMVVDDKQENRQVVVNLLNLTGFETKEAVNGEMQFQNLKRGNHILF